MLTVRTFLTSKEGEESDDCQDSIHPLPTSPKNPDYRFFAVSDGTTTSFFSRVWSQTLTRHFAENPEQTFADWENWLREAQGQWQAQIDERRQASDASFFTRNGFLARRPAAATFAALALGEPTENGRSWRARVLGDSCLFFLRANGEPCVMNLRNSREFSSVVETAESWPKDAPHSPTPYGSSPDGDESPIVEHDTVLLASDALSKWMLLRHERGRPVWGSVLGLNDDSEFADLVEKARLEADDPLENDDVALAVLKFGEPHPVYREQHFEPNPTPKPVPPVSIAPIGDAPGLPVAQEPPQTAASGHSPAPPYSAPMSELTKPRRRFLRFAVLFVLSALSLLGVIYLGVSLSRSRDRIRDLEEHLSAERNNGSARDKLHQLELNTARRELADTMRKAGQDKEAFLREYQDQLRTRESDLKAANQRRSELERENTALRELAKPLPPVSTDSSASVFK